MATREERLHGKLIKDALLFGAEALAAEPAKSLPAGVGLYALAFFNAMHLVSRIPGFAETMIATFETSFGDRATRINANIDQWVAEWEELFRE